MRKGKRSLFPKWCGNNCTSICKKINVDIDLTSFIKIHSKWNKNLNKKCETIKLLEDSIGENLDEPEVYFLDKIPKA